MSYESRLPTSDFRLTCYLGLTIYFEPKPLILAGINS